VSGRSDLRHWAWWALIPWHRTVETLVELRDPENLDEVQQAEETRQAVAGFGVDPKVSVKRSFVVQAHAAKWGSGLALCGATPTEMRRTKLPWTDRSWFPGKAGQSLERCPRCLALFPLSGQ
jgi:hypothetical protein